jgi:uncharacterized lipoprotein NlpE involved in copper resistance
MFMKKKIVTLLLISTVVLSGCGNSSAPSETATTTTETASSESTEDSSSVLDAIGDVEVDEKLLTVELTIPAEYVGETTQEELNATAEEKGFKSITLNDDGSATYVMTKAQHREMMDELAENINSTLADMVGSEDYPNFTDISANDDFTEFTITTTSTELDLNESFSVMAFYMCGGMYNIFNGTPVDNVHVDFINADSGEIINSADSSDTAE